MDLPASGERSVGIPAFRGGRVIFTTIIPDVSSPCSYGGSGWLMELDALTGNRRDTPTFDTNGDNIIDGTDTVGGNTPGGVQNTSIATDPTIQSHGRDEDKYQNTSDSTIPRTREYAGSNAPQRVMWREVR